MKQTDISLLLKIAVRLLDLHDSRRTTGESAQYVSEDRPGLGDGRYVAIAQEVLDVLQEDNARSGEAYSTLAFIQQEMRDRLPWVSDLDVEYVLNVLSRPTELKLLLREEGAPSYVIGDKETHLVEKAPHIVEFRLSKLGKSAVAVAADNADIMYIEGDVIKLIRAIESARLTPALGFVERLLQQLRSEHLLLVTKIEYAIGGRPFGADAITDLEVHRQTMRRAVNLVEDARAKVDELMRKEVPLNDDVPIGLIKAKVKELSAGVVRYGRELSELAELAMRNTTSSVQAPSFQMLAAQWVKAPPMPVQWNTVLSTLGPARIHGVTPTGSDFAGLVKAKSSHAFDLQPIHLDGFDAPVEDQFLEWLRRNQIVLEHQLREGGLDLKRALHDGLGQLDDTVALNCLVTALSAPEEWVNIAVKGALERELEQSHLPGVAVMYSRLALKIDDEATGEAM